MSKTLPFYSFGKGANILFLHGFLGSAQDAKFINNGMVNAVDLPGHGNCDLYLMNKFSMSDTAKLVVNTLKKHSLSRPLLYGYSMGGRLSLYLGIHYPELFSGLILESASPGLQKTSERLERIQLDAKQANLIIDLGIKNFLQKWYQNQLFSNLDKDKMILKRQNNNCQGLANSLLGLGLGSQNSLWSDLSSLSLKTTIVVGENDFKFVDIAKQMTKLILNCNLNIVPNAGHCLNIEAPEYLNKIIKQCLK